MEIFTIALVVVALPVIIELIMIIRHLATRQPRERRSERIPDKENNDVDEQDPFR